MRRYLMFLIVVVCGSTQGFAQKIKTDIFDDLIYESKDRVYKAKFKENIFNDLVFSDNNGNEITFKNKYIEFEYQGLLTDKKAKLDLFISMIHAHSQDRNYKSTYSVDIFDKIIIEDNRNRKVEIGKDIFGDIIYNEESSGVERFMKRNPNGGLEYNKSNEYATLEKSIFKNWTYNDSRGNEFKFSSKTWRGLKNRYGTDENIFHFLIREFLHI